MSYVVVDPATTYQAVPLHSDWIKQIADSAIANVNMGVAYPWPTPFIGTDISCLGIHLPPVQTITSVWPQPVPGVSVQTGITQEVLEIARLRAEIQQLQMQVIAKPAAESVPVIVPITAGKPPMPARALRQQKQQIGFFLPNF